MSKAPRNFWLRVNVAGGATKAQKTVIIGDKYIIKFPGGVLFTDVKHVVRKQV
jgi:hypothetical protein